MISFQDRDDAEVLTVAAERLTSGQTGGVSTRSYSLISDKSIADCVEALIGAVLMHSGQTTALRWVARGQVRSWVL